MRITTAVTIIAFFLPALSRAADIKGQYDDARFPEAELVFNLDKVEPDDPKPRFNTISMGYSRSHGAFDQYLSYGGYTNVEPLHNRVGLNIGYLRFIRHIYFNKHMEMNWGVGLGFSSYQLTGSAAGYEAYFNDKAMGLHGTIGVAYHLTPMIAFEGSLGVYTFVGDNSSSLLAPQAQFSFTPAKTIRLYAGFRNWDHNIKFVDDNLDVQDTLTGPTAGITLYF